MKVHADFATTGQLTEHFTLSEFACNGKGCCGGAAPINPELPALLEVLRDKVGQPLHINSGFRCKVHNARIGGAKFSCHTLGIAADLRTPNGFTVLQFANLARSCGFGKVITYSWGIHVDLRTW